ncbi:MULTISPECIES: hypothetical protein [unclassified Pseudofrankia]|uniref:hypothetical protein n=1 Tax=unclassified Pseudofrankia TaxID=2994372 RepID=UPI0008D90525|nr:MULTISPECIES: hypothetical protein [unclassified Pseudofrankia]MDT3444874.1 hypothetical protein [Pseudofrankia sp. BMG5.37]OHV74207.1 hypothetical protein BCD48_32520 [Pseudofrankia sp. BMG5.36]
MVVTRSGACFLLGLLGLGFAAVLAGCGADAEPAGTGAAPASVGDRPASGSPSTAGSPTSAPATTPALREARDGRDFAACLDRDCQVEVTAGDVIQFAPEFVTNTFLVDQTAGERVDFRVRDDRSGALKGYVAGDGSVDTGDIHVDVTWLADGRLVLTFRPR